MWKNNRPEVINPYLDCIQDHYICMTSIGCSYTSSCLSRAFLLGAEAMYQPAYEKGRADLLEELRKNALLTFDPSKRDNDIVQQVGRILIPDDKKGHLVFIEGGE